VQRLVDEFYESETTVKIAAGKVVEPPGFKARAARFRHVHPELTADAVEALAWCYSWDYK
jgi:hypothetical protein